VAEICTKHTAFVTIRYLYTLMHICWAKWHCDRFFLEYFGFTLSVTFPQSSIFNFIYALLLPEGQTGEAWEPSKM